MYYTDTDFWGALITRSLVHSLCWMSYWKGTFKPWSFSISLLSCSFWSWAAPHAPNTLQVRRSSNAVFVLADYTCTNFTYGLGIPGMHSFHNIRSAVDCNTLWKTIQSGAEGLSNSISAPNTNKNYALHKVFVWCILTEMCKSCNSDLDCFKKVLDVRLRLVRYIAL